MGFGELEGIEDAECFIDIAAERQVVDECVLDDAVFVDDEEAAKCDRLVEENSVVACDLLIQIGHQWETDLADAAFVGWKLFPCKVREM